MEQARGYYTWLLSFWSLICGDCYWRNGRQWAKRHSQLLF